MFLYVNHQPELYVFIRQPPTSICLPLRYSCVWALQGNSIYSQPFGMNSQMIFPRICCLVVTVIMDPVSSKAGKSWKNTKWSTKDSDIMGYISLGTHTHMCIYIYVYAPYICTRGGIHNQHYDMWVCLKMGDISLISGKMRRNIINIDKHYPNILGLALLSDKPK